MHKACYYHGKLLISNFEQRNIGITFLEIKQMVGRKKAFTSDKIFGDKILLTLKCILETEGLQLHKGRDIMGVEFSGEKMIAREFESGSVSWG